MSDQVCVVQNDLSVQLILLVVGLCFHVFEAMVTSLKLRVKCKDCICSLRPKGSSPSPSDTDVAKKPDSSITLNTIVVEK
jgi:hypothetical protein